MGWDTSDSDLETEWIASKEREMELNRKSSEERYYQSCINRIKMVERIEERIVEGTPVRITVFDLPNNFANDVIEVDYRNAQKLRLIENNDQRLAAQTP